MGASKAGGASLNIRCNCGSFRCAGCWRIEAIFEPTIADFLVNFASNFGVAGCSMKIQFPCPIREGAGVRLSRQHS